MPTSKTKELAKKLGLLKRKRKAENDVCSSRKRRRRGQILSYVIVIDFESTCWKDKKVTQEIKFPAVLLDLESGEVVDEFQQYVQPLECPVLSNFCKELTGISQAQVDGGVPLPTCLYLFGRWVRSLREERGVCLMEPGQGYSSCDDNLCALATWSDWDLGVCLQYECRRKQIRKPAYFDQWIDLRLVYKQFYDRRPSGLSGSLEDLGIAFTGREHCGLDDARNTAKLCYRLVKDGCNLNITKSLWKKAAAPLIRAPDLSKEAERKMEESTAQKQENQPSLNALNPVTTIEESPTLGDEENTSQNASLESPSGAQLHKITAEEGQVKTSPSDESFLNGIAHEFDELEKNNFSEVPTTTQCTHADKCSSIKSLNISKACPKANSTPSRSNFLSHILPVTLLPPHNTHEITTANLSTHQQHTSACTSVPRLLQSPSLTHTPKTPTPLLVQQQPPLPPTTIDTSMPHRDANSSTTKQMERRSSFRTPSTTKWIRAKSFRSNSSSILSCDSPQPFNGGKLTPPLCKCGKRAKRKIVTSPGPNQGRPFFSCPGGRGSGCQYFRWESSSPNRSPHTDSSSAANLSSEYS